MPARETADILLRVAWRAARNHNKNELTTAKWMALRFFARANECSRTPAALAQFQGTTRGTVSVTVKSLLAGGYLIRDQAETNGHRVSLRLTDKGHEVLAQNPFEALVQAIESLDASEQTTLHHSLDRLLAAISTTSASRSFGVCRDCTFLIEDKGPAIAGTFLKAAPGRECRLHGIAIQPEDFDLLCIDFQSSERMSLS